MEAANRSDPGTENPSISGRRVITDESNWIQEIIAASESDTRKQPWKATFNTQAVNSRFDEGQDLVTVKRSNGAQPNPLCPFNTQGSSLAA
ncbi:MAG: hypothetical protein Q9170_003842 [Blastenia crenularia]